VHGWLVGWDGWMDGWMGFEGRIPQYIIPMVIDLLLGLFLSLIFVSWFTFFFASVQFLFICWWYISASVSGSTAGGRRRTGLATLRQYSATPEIADWHQKMKMLGEREKSKKKICPKAMGPLGPGTETCR
jgi:hypothetical protein